MHFAYAHAQSKRLSNHQQTIWRWRTKRATQHIEIVSFAKAVNFYFVQTRQSGLKRTQGFLQRFSKVASDRHGLANRLHRCCQRWFGARKFFESKTRYFGYDIINRWLKRRRRRAAGNIIGDFIKRITNSKTRRDFSDGEAGCFRGER